MATRAIAIEDVKTGEVTEAVYEHPFVVRLCHWVNAVSLFVMVGSGLQIFRAFPSFGAKIPQKDLLNWPKAFALGGWLGGALQWHLTFMWIYIATGLRVYRLPDLQRKLQASALCTTRPAGRVADGAPLLLLRPQAADKGSLQPATEARVHLRDWARRAVGADRPRSLEAGAVFLAGVDDGRLPLGAAVAFPDHVGDAGVCVRTFGDGGPAWLEQLRLHVDGMEEGPGIPVGVVGAAVV